MPLPSKAEYERQERMRAVHEEVEIDRSPLRDRREARAAFQAAMAGSPEIVAERIGWLIDGNYGYGQMQIARQIVASPRMNREAALVQTVGVFEWRCPRRESSEAWKKLTAAQKQALSAAVAVVIEAAENEEG